MWIISGGTFLVSESDTYHHRRNAFAVLVTATKGANYDTCLEKTNKQTKKKQPKPIAFPGM